MKNIVVFDTETTGLLLHGDAELSKQPQIIEFGAAMLSPVDGSLVESLNILIDPGVPLPDIIVKITGITDAQLHGQHTFAQALPIISDFFSRCGCMFAHNLPFDKGMLRNELARLGAEDFPWPELGYCTVGLYKDNWGRNPKMTELYEYAMGKPLAQTHRALDDVMALVEIIQAEKLWELAQ